LWGCILHPGDFLCRIATCTKSSAKRRVFVQRLLHQKPRAREMCPSAHLYTLLRYVYCGLGWYFYLSTAPPHTGRGFQRLYPAHSFRATKKSRGPSRDPGIRSGLCQTLMSFSASVSSKNLSQLASIFWAIASSSARFWRATSAVSVSPAFSARRSRS
jgi:hypothetical protein